MGRRCAEAVLFEADRDENWRVLTLLAAFCPETDDFIASCDGWEAIKCSRSSRAAHNVGTEATSRHKLDTAAARARSAGLSKLRSTLYVTAVLQDRTCGCICVLFASMHFSTGCCHVSPAFGEHMGEHVGLRAKKASSCKPEVLSNWKLSFT